MVKQALLLAAVAAVALAASGCGFFHAVYYEPYGPGLGPDIAHCPNSNGDWEMGAGCDVACGRAPCAGHRSGRYATCEVCGRSYGSAECGPYTDGHCGPLTLVFALFRHHGFWGSGCGGRYYGEWLSDPPDCCDPCEFSAAGVPYEATGEPGGVASCPECQGFAAGRRPPRGAIVQTPPTGWPASSAAMSGTRPPSAGYAARRGSAPRPAYGPRPVPQAARAQSAPASYAY